MTFDTVSLPDWKSFAQFQGVTNIKVDEVNFQRNVATSPSSAPQQVLFAIDTIHDDAFLHWQCQSAVFLRYWSEIKEVFPDVKILLDKDRVYKRLTLQAYGIPDDRIIFGGNSSLPAGNLCILPPPFLMHERDIDVPVFSSLWAAHIQFLRRHAGVSDDDAKSIEVLALPRQTRENYAPNDRVVVGTRKLAGWAPRRKGATLHTDTVTDLKDQVRMVARSKIIVMDYGSSYYVNGSLATNSLIVVACRPHPTPYRAGQAIDKWILSRGNRIVHVATLEDAMRFVDAEILTRTS